MTSEQWRRVRELFEAALEAAPADAHAWLQGQPAEADVRAEVASLLDHNTRAGSFLAGSLPERAPELLGGDGALEPGAVVGHYTIVREIGRGAMGRVYLADDVTLGRAVALKALPPHLTSDPSYRERLRREARAAAGLAHSGIAIVHALEEFDGQLFIVSEYVDGQSLRDEIGGGNTPGADAIGATAVQLAEALSAAHARGITHRDFKPENVMRDRSGRLKVLDFGVACTPDSGVLTAGAMATLPGVLVGTPAYMAPEQLNGERADVRADVFAYGVVMYEYACGVHPFDASTPLGLVARVLETDARPIAERAPHVPASVAIVIDRCLRKLPADRFASATGIVEALGTDAARTGTISAGGASTWWHVHQVAVLAVYVVATVVSWWIKESFVGSVPLSAFVSIGACASVAGIVRAHLLFTSFVNRPRLRSEGLRTRSVLTTVDVLMAASLAVDGFTIASVHPLWGVLTLGLAAGVALATLLIEPATASAMLPE